MKDGKYLGKIASLTFGPHPDTGFGLWLDFAFGGGGTAWFEPITNGERLQLLMKWCREAKVYDLYQLKGKPVEVEVEEGLLRNWRILTEVL